MRKRDPQLTDLQRRVVHEIAAAPAESASTIAETVDCSRSYVDSIRSDYAEIVESIQDLKSVSCMPSFGHPYSILLPEPALDRYYLEEGDILQLTFLVDGDQRESFGVVKQYEQPADYNRERRARSNGAFQSLPALQSEDAPGFDEFETLDNEHALLSTDQDLRTFLDAIEEVMHWHFESAGVLVGVGIMEIVHRKRDPESLLSTPQFKLERSHFVDYFLNEGPELIDVRRYSGPVSEPDDVYFSYYGESLDDSQMAELRETILEYEMFTSAWNYALPGYPGVVGPTTTNPTDDVLRVTEDSLHVVEGVEQEVELYNESETQGLTPEMIVDAISSAKPEFDSLASTTRYTGDAEELPLRKNDNRIYLLFDQVTIVLTVRPDRITWEYPKGISHVEWIVTAVTDMIQRHLGLQSSWHQPIPPQYPRIDIEEWVFDTNALYHDHTANRPTSILHTVFTHRYFNSSTIHIPWAVLYEMNKHPESGSASEAVNRQGFENLAILRTLEQLGWLTVDVQTPPETPDVDLASSDIADMQILGFASNNGCYLLSGDRSLIDIAKLATVPAVDISQLDTLQTTDEDESQLDAILASIGDDLQTVSKIREAVDDVLDSGATIPAFESSRTSPTTPSAIIEGWEADGSIIRYCRSDGTACLAPCQSVKVVPTRSVLEFLPAYLDSSDPPLLRDDFLESVAAEIRSIEDPALPSIKLLVPSEYVIEMISADRTPSEFNKGMLTLAAASNLEYETNPALSAELGGGDASVTGDGELISGDDYPALCLAKQHDDAHLLVAESRESTWKFHELFGINAVPLNEPDD